MAWAINNTLDVCKGAISPGVEYAESYLEAVWTAAKGESKRIKETAAGRGKLVHTILEGSFKGSPDSSDSSVVRNVGLWASGLGLQLQSIERRIYSRRYRYSGTLDATAKVAADDKKLVLIDWKTGKSIYPEYRLQTAAYVLAYEEEFPDQKIQGRYLVRIAEDGSIEPHFFDRSTLRKDIQAFLGAKALFDQVQRIEKENRKSLKTKELEFSVSVDK